MQVVGLYVASALYLAFYMRWIGRHALARHVGLAVGVPGRHLRGLRAWFLVPMPKGPLEAWLGY